MIWMLSIYFEIEYRRWIERKRLSLSAWWRFDITLAHSSSPARDACEILAFKFAMFFFTQINNLIIWILVRTELGVYEKGNTGHLLAMQFSHGQPVVYWVKITQLKMFDRFHKWHIKLKNKRHFKSTTSKQRSHWQQSLNLNPSFKNPERNQKFHTMLVFIFFRQWTPTMLICLCVSHYSSI